MRLSQANADLAEAADKLEAIRKKLAVCAYCCGLFFINCQICGFSETNVYIVDVNHGFPYGN